MLSPSEEKDYFFWKDSELDFQNLLWNSRDILQQIPEADGLREFHLSRDLFGDINDERSSNG